MNYPGAPGTGVWPEDQVLHRGRKTRPPPVWGGSSPLSNESKKKDIGPRRSRSRRCPPPYRGLGVEPKSWVHPSVFLSRRWEHLHARALQIRAELSTHIHRETGPQRPTHSFWSFLFEKTKLERGKKPPAFRQRQAHDAVRHAARSRPARSAPGHRARTRAEGRRA